LNCSLTERPFPHQTQEVQMDIIYAVIGLLTEPWLILVLVASVMFAIGNYLDEMLLGEYEQEVGTLVINSGIFGLVLMAIFATIAYFINTSVAPPSSIVYQALGIGVLEVLWVIPYLCATDRRGAMIAGPLFQAVPVIALGFEAVGGTIPPLIQIGGAVLIILGGVLLSIEKEENEDGETNHTVDWITVGLMMVSAVIIALIYVLFKDAADGADGYIAVGFWTGLGMFLAGLAIWLVVPKYRKDFNAFARNANGKAVGIQFINEIMDAGGAYLTHLANVLGPSVMLVTAFNATQPIAIALVGALLGLFGIKHANSDSKISWLLIGVAIVLIAAGTVVVAL
jgi:drug/metabolite transporter (DMT)-like permease